MAEKSLKGVFEEYAAFGRRGTGKPSDITGSNFSKMVKEKGLMDKKLNKTEVDMIFTKVKTKGANTITFAQFEKALDLMSAAKHPGDKDGLRKIEAALLGGGGPSTTSTTAASKSDVVGRMTDTSKYTGSHKERFDESGKGKGKEGREYLAKKSGYVTGYKQEDTYDKTH